MFSFLSSFKQSAFQWKCTLLALNILLVNLENENTLIQVGYTIAYFQNEKVEFGSGSMEMFFRKQDGCHHAFLCGGKCLESLTLG